MCHHISIFQCHYHKQYAGQGGLLLWPSSAFFHLFHVLILIYKTGSSKLVLQSCLWSSIRKSDVQFSGLGSPYTAAFPNYLPHVRQELINRMRVRSPRNRLASKQWRGGEHELNHRLQARCVWFLRIMRILYRQTDASPFLKGLVKEQGIV